LVDGVSVNSWVRIKAVQLTPGQYDHVLVEQDINTLAEELTSRRFEPAQMAGWFREASRQFDTVLELYFPPMPTEGAV